MKRVCIFAHYDRDDIVDDYVIYYLKALQKICATIIFVSDCNLSKEEIKKIEAITDFVIAKKHGEYEFGSYKRGFLYAKELGLEIDELLLANDSCYGPFFSLKPIFDEMSKKKCDFWGLTSNVYGIRKKNDNFQVCYKPHIQSYFLVLKANTLSTFEKFVQKVKKESTKEEIVINYEIGLSLTLKKAGFKSDFYFKCYSNTYNPVDYKWDKLIVKYKFPFLKTSIPKYGLVPFGIQKEIENIIPNSYPFIFIENQIKRLGGHYECKYKTMNLQEKFLLMLSLNCPMIVYFIFNFILNFIDKKIVCSFYRFLRFLRNNF